MIRTVWTMCVVAAAAQDSLSDALSSVLVGRPLFRWSITRCPGAAMSQDNERGRYIKAVHKTMNEYPDYHKAWKMEAVDLPAWMHERAGMNRTDIRWGRPHSSPSPASVHACVPALHAQVGELTCIFHLPLPPPMHACLRACPLPHPHACMRARLLLPAPPLACLRTWPCCSHSERPRPPRCLACVPGGRGCACLTPGAAGLRTWGGACTRQHEGTCPRTCRDC